MLGYWAMIQILLPSGKSDPPWRLFSGDKAVEKWALKRSKVNAYLILENSWPTSLALWNAELVLSGGFFFHWGCVCVFADYVMWCFRTMASFSIQIPRAFAVCVNLLLFSRTWHLGYLFRWYLYLGPHDHIARGSGAYCMADMVLGALLCQNLMGRVKRMSAFSFVSIDFTVWQ